MTRSQLVTMGAWVWAAGLVASSVEGQVPVGRILIRDGALVDVEVGARFVPVGANYYRLGDLGDGKVGHATFCDGSYDRHYIETMMAQLREWGLNTIRTFHVYHVGENGILASREAREIEPRYLENTLHFLQQARDNGIHVVFAWDVWLPPSEWWSQTPLPDEETLDLLPDWVDAMGVNGFHFCRGAVRTRANAIRALIEAIRERDPGLLPVVLAWELENEVCVTADREPFRLAEGVFSFGGREYDMASDSDKQALMDAVLVQWANACAATIREADPEALVSVSMYPFAAVGRGGPGTLSMDQTQDPRVPGRPLAMLDSSVDLIDLHIYNWMVEDEPISACVDRLLASSEWDAVLPRAVELGKPVIVGETAIAAHYLRQPPDWGIDHEMGLQWLGEQLDALREKGVAGSLYWHYGNPESDANDEIPALELLPRYARVLRDAW